VEALPETAIEEVTQPTPEVVDALGRLLAQLSSSAKPPGPSAVTRLVNSEGSHLLIARDEAQVVVGTLTLVVFETPRGVRARIEDVVVDASARGRGFGESLTRCALAIARRRGAVTVDLTTRGTREVANRLYRRIGFERRDTNVYRFTLDGERE